MARRQFPLVLFILLCSFVVLPACNNNNNSPTTNPDPIQTTETFTGTLNPLLTASHPFNVNYQYSYTDAAVTVTSLTSVATGAAANITIGVGFGNYNVGVCTRVASVSNPTVAVNQEVPTTNQPFSPGPYCVQLFDNPDSPTVKEPLRYSLSLKHY